MKQRLRFVAPYILLTIVSFLFFYAVDSEYSVRYIKIEGIDDIKGIEQYTGESMFLISEEEIQEDLYSVNPQIASVTVFKQMPDTLYVTARNTRPRVTVLLADGHAMLGEDGTVLAKNRTDDVGNLPTISYYQPLFFNQFTIGDQVSEKGILAAASFTNLLLDLGIGITSIDITNENMIVLLTDNFEVLMTSEKDVQTQFDTFAYTYKELNKAGAAFRSIDVRFEKPIIKLQE